MTMLPSSQSWHDVFSPRVLVAAVAGLLTCVSNLSAQTIMVDFESPTAMDAFNQQNISGSPVTVLTQASGVGVGGSGGATYISSSSDVTAIYKDSSLDFTSGSSFAFSTDYHKTSGDNQYTVMQEGFFVSNDVSTGSSNQYINFRLVGPAVTGANDTYRLQLSNRDSNNPGDVNLGSTISILNTNNDWFRLSGTLQLIDMEAGLFSYSIELLNLGSDGTSTPVVVSSATGTLTNMTLAADTSLWYGFRDPGASSAMDNMLVAAVPEPGSLTLLGAACLMLAIRRRRSRPARRGLATPAVLGGCLLAGILPLGLRAANMDLVDGQFEKGLDDWTVQVSTRDTEGNWIEEADTEKSVQTSAHAAHGGKAGMVLRDRSTERGLTVMSPPFAVDPGQKLQLALWARCREGAWHTSATLFFKNEKGWAAQAPTDQPQAILGSNDEDWRRFEVELVVPENATEAMVWIHTSTDKEVDLDIDDVELTKIQ